MCVHEASLSSATYVASVDHGYPMEFCLFGECFAATLKNGDHFSGQTLLQRLPRLAVACFEDPFHSIPGSVLLTQGNGFVDALRAISMG